MNDITHPDLGLTARDASACGCASHAEPGASETHLAPAIDGATADAAIDYRVTGMTCAHCVASVTEEISAIDGIDTVQVRLNVGGESLVSVRGVAAADRAAVAAAVDEAGYALAGE